MNKRTEKDPNDTEALGLSRSERRALDVAEGIRRDLDRVQREIDNIEDTQRSVGFDAAQVEDAVRVQSEVASLGLDEARVRLDDMRVNLADFRPDLGSNVIPSASEVLQGQIASVRDSLCRPASLLGENVVKGLAKPPIPPSHISQILDTRSRIQGMFRTLPEVAVKPSPVLPTAAMATRISDMAKGFATSEILKNQQGLYRSVQTANASVAKSLAGQIMATNPLSDTSLVMRNSIATSVHSMNANLIASWRSMLIPNIEAVGRQLNSGLLGILSQYDWEALERDARIQDARRPRTPIGFAALKAYDALCMGARRVADEFLDRDLGIEPTADRREALWTVLYQAFARTLPVPARWIELEDRGAAIRYLRTAIYNEEWRIRRDREMADRIWWPEGEEERDKEGIRLSKPALCPDAPLAFLLRSSPSPESLLIPPPDDRGEVLTQLYQDGTPEDKEFVRLLLIGHELEEISRVYGPQKVQRFKRKAQRWRNKLNLPTDGY